MREQEIKLFIFLHPEDLRSFMQWLRENPPADLDSTEVQTNGDMEKGYVRLQLEGEWTFNEKPIALLQAEVMRVRMRFPEQRKEQSYGS